MDERLGAYLDRLYSRGRAADAGKADRLERLRNVEPETAALLALLVRAMSCRDVLELGTSNGYSTLWLADAVRATGGRVVSVDVDPARTALAAENLRGAGLDGQVELRSEDAAQTLREAPDASFDLVFLDAERPAYPGYWPDLRRVVRAPGLLFIDNALSHAEELTEFRGILDDDGSLLQSLVPIGAGVLLVTREGPAAGTGP